MRPLGRATGAVGRSLGDTCRGEDARRGSSIPRSPVSRKPHGAFCVWASLLMPDAAHRFGVRLRVGLAAAAAPLLRAGPPARLALCVRACLLPHHLPLCAGPAGLSSPCLRGTAPVPTASPFRFRFPLVEAA